jgi:hypothetical protein
MSMGHDHHPHNRRRYRVQVGHTATTVESASPSEAIQEARRRLCLDNPRLWDVITQMEDARFEVREE